jgi:hypothetical protein
MPDVSSVIDGAVSIAIFDSRTKVKLWRGSTPLKEDRLSSGIDLRLLSSNNKEELRFSLYTIQRMRGMCI